MTEPETKWSVKKNGGVMFVETSDGSQLMLVPKYVNSIRCTQERHYGSGDEPDRDYGSLQFVQMYGTTAVTTYLDTPTFAEAQLIYREILVANKLTEIEDVEKLRIIH